jgi:hypothetical protein
MPGQDELIYLYPLAALPAGAISTEMAILGPRITAGSRTTGSSLDPRSAQPSRGRVCWCPVAQETPGLERQCTNARRLVPWRIANTTRDGHVSLPDVFSAPVEVAAPKCPAPIQLLLWAAASRDAPDLAYRRPSPETGSTYHHGSRIDRDEVLCAIASPGELNATEAYCSSRSMASAV